jgi:Na+/melibiose symporter-like transporter
MKKFTSVWRMIVLNTYWIGLSFKWNALHPIILPAVMLNYAPEGLKNTYLGVLTFVGLMVAAILQPVAGAVSDGWHSRWGRRRPFMVVATLFDLVFLALIGWAGGLFWLFIGYIGLQFSSNVGQGPAQGLLPDRVAPEKIGVASGIKTFMDMAALIIASLAAGHLLDPQGKDPTLIMLVVMVVMVITAGITIFGTPEEPTNREGSNNLKSTGWWHDLRGQLHVDLRENTAYWWLIGQRLVFLLGIYAVQAFAQYYLRDVLRAENPVQATGDLLAALTVALVILALVGGWLADRFGAKRILYVAGGLVAVGMLLFRLAQTPTMLVGYGSIVGAGIGLFLTASWALSNKLAPADQAGKFLGLTNLATAGAGALSRLEGPVIDVANNAYPGVWAGYTGMFVFGAICAVLSMVMLTRIKLPEGK